MSIHETAHIHNTAIVDDRAEIGPQVTIGPFSLITGDVEIGEGTIIKERVSIEGHTRVGMHNHIFAGAVIGSWPQDLHYAGAPTQTIVGDHNLIREYVTINAATPEGEGRTVVGNHCAFLTHSHVGHNCVVEDHVTLVNAVNLGGFVTVGEGAYIGGAASVHQFVRVGRNATISGYSKTIQDAPPYMTVAGQPTRVVGLNSVGLDRAGFSDEDKRLLKRALRLLFRSGLTYSSALQQLEDFPPSPHIAHLMEFMRTSSRGVCRGK
ncbi:acyl-ACP--UDP-N-acetylglucosamine O-acyltransferase [Desulfovibrio inopinatus]|uniref:acyl-ACP--UDP-N-acetylglucosamine O-acyltransferase n=1 Tax=Desulfovibrio inopinatus TaxID=102109 RepID=UPI0003FFFF3E|nr:acyl-ACP--UDP-N-acetylglucosamine O-acyltransferase [Desulfovibrio inopinatus]